MINDFLKQLFSCFNAGYTIPQFCIDNNYMHPIIVTDSDDLMIEIYEQFWFYKKINARYMMIGKNVVLKAWSNLNTASIKVESFSVENCQNSDIILYLSNTPLEVRPPVPMLNLKSLTNSMLQYAFWERPIYSFIKRHPGVKVITLTHTSMIENEFNTELEKRVLKENFRRTIIGNREKNSTEHVWTPLDEFGYSNDEVLDLLDMPSATTDWKGCTFFNDSNGTLFNSKNGKRQTAYQPEIYKHVIYMLGTCVCVGYAAPWDKTMPSYLQKILNDNNEEYLVENVAQFYNGRYQDIFYNLNNLPVKDGDIIFICLDNQLVRDVPSFYIKNIFKRPHNYGELYIDKYHINERGYKVIAEKFYDFLKENNYFDDYDYNTELISREISRPHMFGIPEWAENQNSALAQPEELTKYQAMLKEHEINTDDEVDAIVMNCNPFTLGHQYLIETAAGMVSQLYVFVVEEDKSIFPFADRIDLVRKGTAHLHNVTVLPSGKFMISSLTFSDYFNKSSLQDTVIDTSMDVELFAEKIAPVLNIKVRFAGEEPLDKVTNQYNESMKQILPQHGIKFVEIPRKTFGGDVISASRVRKLLEENNLEEISRIVPESTYRYLMERSRGLSVSENRKPLNSIIDLEEYISALSTYSDVTVFIVSKDAHTNPCNSNERALKRLAELGITEDLDKQYRWAFLAHIDRGNVKICRVSENERLSYICEFNGNRAMLISEGYNVKTSNICDGKIIINKKQVSVDKRGLNFVVWDNKTNTLLDSVCFDTFADGKAFRKK